jgi:sec-independent protein translocase protein TatA
MPHLGVPELLIILVIIVLLFGVGRVPKIGEALDGIREFRESSLGLPGEAASEASPRKGGKPSSP